MKKQKFKKLKTESPKQELSIKKSQRGFGKDLVPKKFKGIKKETKTVPNT
jgi:hypothetical protein